MASIDITEEWRSCKDHPDYEVSNLGRVRKGHRILAITTIPKYGYVMVQFTAKPRQKKVYVHRLVAFAFLPEPSSGQVDVDHVDNDKANNAVTNLQWLSRQENVSRKALFGTLRRKISAEQRATMIAEAQNGGDTYCAIAARYGVSAGYLSRLVKDARPSA